MENTLHRLALARAEEKNISYGAALHEIQCENPEFIARYFGMKR